MNVAHMVMLLVIASLAFADQNPSLAAVLTPDGRIMEGASGSFDPEGFRMTYGPNGEPLFVAEASLSGEPAPFPERQYDGGTWHPLGSGVPSAVLAIAVSGSDVYIGGIFIAAGGSPANHIARWDGSSWHALGDGVSDWVHAIAVSGSDVYVGGYFTKAGGSLANYIARWDGSNWHALGDGVSGPVYAITVSGSDVYVGGRFTQAGGTPANHIARWDDNSDTWCALGSGVSDWVYAIAVSGSDVYVGGQFTHAGGSPASRIARWDGSSWHPLGTGVGDYVYAIAVSGSDVYVGGIFDQAGGSPANYIARWDVNSDTWSALGTGVGNWVYAIAVSGSDLYVGGCFTLVGGNSVNRIARWDGIYWHACNWHPLGAGVNHEVRAIAVSGSDVYVGGKFSQAGGSPANKIARWEPNTGIGTTPEETPVSPHASLHASPNPTSTGTELSFQSIGLSPLTLEIYDTAGRLVRTEALGTLPAGSQAHYWNGQGGNGQALAQGVYFVRLSSDEIEASTRVVLLR